MLTGITPPFLKVDVEEFEQSPWMTSASQHPLHDGELLPHWDPATPVDADKYIRIDLGRLMDLTGLPEGSLFAIMPSWWSPGTGLRGCGAALRGTLQSSGVLDGTLRLSIPGRDLGLAVKLRVAVVLVARPKGSRGHPLAARRPGSVLWEDSITIILEGVLSRFPTTPCDFEASGLGSRKACWSFEWRPKDLHAPAMSSLRLLVNTANRRFFNALTSLMPSDRDLAVRSAVKYEMAMKLLSMGLEMKDEIEAGGYEEGTTGRVLADLMDRLFGGMPPGEIDSLRRQDPGRFEAMVQAALGLFSEPGIREGGA